MEVLPAILAIFVIHRSPVDTQHKWLIIQSYGGSLVVSLDKYLNQQLNNMRVETL